MPCTDQVRLKPILKYKILLIIYNTEYIIQYIVHRTYSGPYAGIVFFFLSVKRKPYEAIVFEIIPQGIFVIKTHERLQ